MQLRNSRQVVLARRARLVAAAAAVTAGALTAPRASADGTFTSTQSANVTWETGTIWPKTGDTGSQVYPGDGVGPNAGSETAVLVSTGGGRTWNIGGPAGWSYTLNELRNLENESGQHRGAAITSTNAGTLNVSLFSHTQGTGSTGTGNFQVGSDASQLISVVSNNLVMNAAAGHVRLDETNVTFNSLTTQGPRDVTFEDNNGAAQTWNMNGATEVQGTGLVTFRYQAAGAAGDTKLGTGGLTTLRANATGGGLSNMLFTRAIGSVVNRFSYSATTLDSDLRIDTDNTHVALGAITVNGTRTLDLRDSSTAMTNNGVSFTSVTGAAGSALTVTGSSTHDVEVARWGGMLGSVSALDAQLNVKDAAALNAVATAKLEGQLNLDFTPAAGAPRYDVQAGGIISGSNDQLKVMTRGTEVLLAPDAVVAHETNSADSVSGVGSIQNLGTNADLFFGVATAFTQNLTVGTGTAWKGISGDRSGRDWTTGTITANSDFVLQGVNDATLKFGNGTAAGSVSIDTGGVARTVTVQGTGGSVVALDDPDALYNNVTFNVNSGVLGFGANGFGANPAGVTVNANAGGTVDLRAANAFNGTVNVKAGGILRLDDGFGPNGTGTIVQEPGSIVRITNAAALLATSGTQQPIGTVPGSVVRLEASDINELDSLINDGVYYVITNGDRSQKTGLTINGGGLYNGDAASGRTFTNSVVAGANNVITIGAQGALIAATNNQDFPINPNVVATGPVTVNTTATIDGAVRSGDVKFNGTFTAPSVNVANRYAVFNNAATNVAGDITVQPGATLFLAGGGESANTGVLTDRLTSTTGAVADRVANNIVLKATTLSEMGFISPAAGRLTVTQPFTIEGDVNSASKRRFYVSRRTGTAVLGVDYANLTMKDGAVFAVQEDNTDVRARYLLEGTATMIPGVTAHDLIGTARAPGAPAFDGSNFATLNWNRTAEAAMNQNVYGNIGAGTRVDMIKGQAYFQSGSSIDGVVRTQTAPSGGDSYVRIFGGADGTVANRVTGAGSIELGFTPVGAGATSPGGEDIDLLVDADKTNQLGVKIVVVDDGLNNVDGIIRVTRNAGTTTTGVGEYRSVEVRPGAQLTAGATNSTLNIRELAVGAGALANLGNITTGLQMDRLAGAGTVRNPSIAIVPGGVLAPGASPGTLTLDGGNLALGDGATYQFEIGAGPASSDLVNLTAANSTVGFGTTLNLDVRNVAGADPTGQTYVLFDYTGTDPAALPALTFTGLTGDVSIDSANSRIVLTNVAVPEPASLTLIGLAATGLLRRRRR